MFLNRSSAQKHVQYSFKANIVTDAVTKTTLAADKTVYKLLNVWTNKDAGTTAKDLNFSLAPHEVLMLRLHK